MYVYIYRERYIYIYIYIHTYLSLYIYKYLSLQSMTEKSVGCGKKTVLLFVHLHSSTQKCIHIRNCISRYSLSSYVQAPLHEPRHVFTPAFLKTFGKSKAKRAPSVSFLFKIYRKNAPHARSARSTSSKQMRKMMPIKAPKGPGSICSLKSVEKRATCTVDKVYFF